MAMAMRLLGVGDTCTVALPALAARWSLARCTEHAAPDGTRLLTQSLLSELTSHITHGDDGRAARHEHEGGGQPRREVVESLACQHAR